MRPVTKINDFEKMYSRSSDPWQTFSNRDERCKRETIRHSLGARRHGLLLELGAGNGSNSVMFRNRALNLDICEGTEAGVKLIEGAMPASRSVNVYQVVLPARLPRSRYDAIVIAELLYYFSDQKLTMMANMMDAAARDGTLLVLAHHHIQLTGFAQIAKGLHQRFVNSLRCRSTKLGSTRTSRWIVDRYILSR